MVKKMLNTSGVFNNTTLVILGWLTFLCSFFISELYFVIPLQMIARVLP